jgi:hypothetical protein
MRQEEALARLLGQLEFLHQGKVFATGDVKSQINYSANDI